jgi:monoamine oxidase
MLKTEDGVAYYCHKLVITSSPLVLKSDKMIFSPPLSKEIKNALETTNMHNIVKVFLKFSEPVWPRDLHGMIMADEEMLLPEIWFKDVANEADKDEPAKALAIAFTTADYAAKIASLPKEEVLKKSLDQLDTIFSMLEPRHMSAEINDKGI